MGMDGLSELKNKEKHMEPMEPKQANAAPRAGESLRPWRLAQRVLAARIPPEPVAPISSLVRRIAGASALRRFQSTKPIGDIIPAKRIPIPHSNNPRCSVNSTEPSKGHVREAGRYSGGRTGS